MFQAAVVVMLDMMSARSSMASTNVRTCCFDAFYIHIAYSLKHRFNT